MKNTKVFKFEGIIPWLVPVLLLLIWQICSVNEIISSRLFPPPTAIILTAIDLFKSGELYYHMGISTYRALVGLLIGGGIGFILGLINGLFPFAGRFFDSTIQMVRNVPHLALIPLVIIWFGIGETAKIFLVSLGVFFPIYVNTYHGIRTVDRGLIEMGRVYGLSAWELFRKIILPGALPSIFVGLRYSLGLMWLTLIVAETIASDSGIGYMAMNAREFMKTDVIILSIIIYALLGKLADILAKLIEEKTLKWHPSYAKKK
ncbi:aliphatic sulfonate ABC transporter permease SsuC [Lederbergia lenta]|uniref:ABC transporter integral membrane protein n=1 Tax=Lederbergia lenta TaxID=1467 RepID=A0A2X4WYF4_LEDLE|nr:aliphatic sulfonate ABC transporter permease SsuC [Lederbergia lenta]MCM3112933.1 aliphatic sulfonate ABC transporter permease SsuC [Lederbergia lenta]MEC2326100.1 aliphatic sulfonate ABC transporter permease SsuC [Lederbergia lenta]SQI63462.1 ABC transporter integral membrane protein [Lederbergia lenta]